MRRTLPLLILSSLAAAAAGQSRHDSSAPIDFGADHIELQDKSGRGILSGNVKVRQAEMTLDSARMIVTYTGQVVDGSQQVSRLDAAGNVVVTRPDQSARGQYAVYDLNKHLITMLGGVTLVQNANRVNGARLTINMDTGRAVIDGSSAGSPSGATGGNVTSAPGGRVTGRFSVPKRNTTGSAAPAPAATPAPAPTGN
jgi:lipopolysaccharide export system protein LptA